MCVCGRTCVYVCEREWESQGRAAFLCLCVCRCQIFFGAHYKCLIVLSAVEEVHSLELVRLYFPASVLPLIINSREPRGLCESPSE